MRDDNAGSRRRPGSPGRRKSPKPALPRPDPVIEEQRKRLREQTERLRILVHESAWRQSALFDLAPVGYAVLDHTGRIEAVNLALSSLIGRPRAHLVGVPLAVMIPPEDRHLFLDHMQRCRESEGEAVASDLRLLRTDTGQIFGRLVSRLAHHPGPSRLYLTAVLDMSGRVNAEKALHATEMRLRDMNSELEHRAASAEHTASQLRMLASQLNRTEQKERRRIAGLLHDHLQQFLVSAKIHLKLTGRSQEDLPGRLRRVEGLIDQALLASRTLTLELSPPVLHDAGLAAALGWLARFMADKNNLRVDLDVNVASDPEDSPFRTFIFEAIREMLLNVVKHARVEKASVSVHRVDDEMQVSVSDEGGGFDPSILQRAAPGDHVGLMTLRERVHQLGGSLEILASPGKGTTVLLRCPIPAEVGAKPQPPRGRRSRAGAPAASHNGAIRVMVVDDHNFLREGLIRILEDEGLSVVGEAADGRAAVIKAREVAPDIVIMDVTLPEMNGIEATRIIRQENPRVRVIGLSMHESGDMEEGMLAAGASAYMTKGGPVDQLVEKIRQVTAAPVNPEAVPE